MWESNYCPNMKINPARIPMNECLLRTTLNMENLSTLSLVLLRALVDLFKSKSYLKSINYIYNDQYACIIRFSVQALDPRLAWLYDEVNTNKSANLHLQV